MADTKSAPNIGTLLELRLPRLIAAWREVQGFHGRNHGYRQPRATDDTHLSTQELDSAGTALVRLQRGLTGGRRLAGSSYMSDPALLGAYLLYYWPVSYLEASLALAELGIHPRRVLDLGSGPGPASAAAVDRGAESIDLADASEQALKTALRLLEPRAASVSVRRIDLESDTCLSSFCGPYDLVILGHCLNEIRHRQHERIEYRKRLLMRAAGLLSQSGIILAFEPALLETTRELITLRDALAEQGYKIIQPCPRIDSGSYPCPVLASGPDRSCHVEAAWKPPEPVASLAAAAGLDRQSVKFAYFAVGRERGSDAQEPGSQQITTTDTAPPAPGAVLEGRVISDPMLNKAGRIRYILCSNGSLAAVSAPKDSSEAGRSGFFSLKRGDILRVIGAEQRPGGGLGLGPDSSIEVLARFPEIDP